MVAAADIIEEWKTRPFQWGVNDCARFAQDFFLRAFGVRAMKEWEFAVSSSREFKERYPDALFIYRERLSSAGFLKVINPGNRPAVAIIHMGKQPPALGVWSDRKLWMLGKMGAEEVEPCVASEFWELPTN